MEFETVIQRLYHHRNGDAIKNDFGKTLILGGSLKYPSSVLIAASFASLSGTGFVSLGVPHSIYPIVVSKAYPTWIFEPCHRESDSLSYSDDERRSIARTYTSILFGNGIADSSENRNVLEFLLSQYDGNLVIDATGLSLLREINPSRFSCNVVLTPHLGEAGRLFGLTSHSRNPKDYVASARNYIQHHPCHILLKSSRSVLVGEKGEYENDFLPTPSLAKAGSGDGLAGYLAGLLSYAGKDFDTDDLILFADLMIHRAAYLSALEESDGLADIMSCIGKIRKIIKDGK